MDGGKGAPLPRTVDDVFKDFRGRRIGLLKALVKEVEQFFLACDPGRGSLCLFGFPNGKWELRLPTEKFPPEIPEPAVGINFSRDGMDKDDWLSLIAVHSDSWLVSVTFYFAQRFGFDGEARRKLFDMINSVPTVSEVVIGEAAKKRTKKETLSSGNESNKSGSKTSQKSDAKSTGTASQKQQEDSVEDGEEEDGEEEDEHGSILCFACFRYYADGEFWICCDVCDQWYHGACVRITPARAEQIKEFTCPSCCNKMAIV